MKDYINSVDSLRSRVTIDPTTNRHGDAFVEFLHESKMCVLNGRVTPEFDNFTSISTRGSAVVDYIAVPHSTFDLCTDFRIRTSTDLIDELELCHMLSNICKAPDHAVLVLQVNVHADLNTSAGTNQSDQSTPETEQGSSEAHASRKYSFDNIPTEFLQGDILENILIELEGILLDREVSQVKIDLIYDNFCATLFSEMDSFLEYRDVSKKVRKRFKNHKPYWNDNLTQLWKSMRDAERRFLRCKGARGERSSLRSAFQLKQYCFDKCLRKTERDYNRAKAEEIESINTENPQKYWEHINKLGPQNKSSIPLQVYDADGALSSDSDFVLNKWKTDFSELLNKPDIEGFDDNFYRSRLEENDNFEKHHLLDEAYINSILEKDISAPELEKVIRNVKAGKAVGPDYIPNDIFKTGKVTEVLLPLLKVCFQNNIIPGVWQRATIVPIPKSSTKDPYIPLNYRGISLLSCVFKLYTTILNNRLVEYGEKYKLFVEEQNGFRKGRSCVDHLYSLSSIVRNRNNQGLNTYACFVDFQKAFDWVDRDLLFNKLSQMYMIGGNFYKAIKSLYSTSMSRVRVSDKQTDWFNVASGVRQGDALSPTLFSLFLNDLAIGIKGLNCGIPLSVEDVVSILLYADDIVLLSDSEEGLQQQLDYLNQWCSKWRLVVNKNKTEVVHFRRKHKDRTSFEFSLGVNALNITDEYRYLGLVLNEHMDFSATGQILADAGGRAFGALRNKLHYLRECRYDTFTKLYVTCVTPILDYSAGVWGYKFNQKPENVQHRAIRSFLGVHRFAPNHAIYGDIGWVSSQLRRHIEICRLWNRLVDMPLSRLPRRILEWELDFNNNWASEVKTILCKVDMQFCYNNKVPCDLQLVRENLEAQEVDKWERERFLKPKLRLYNLYKRTLEPEIYVTNMPKHLRSLLAQYRAGILPLAVETGRFSNTPLEERICISCKENVEDEFHVLCSCPQYNELREILYAVAQNSEPEFDRWDPIEKFVYLNNNNQHEVAKYLEKVMRMRRLVLLKE